MYKITGDDVLAGKKFSDGILCSDIAADNVGRCSNAVKNISLIEKGIYYQNC